MKTRFFIILMLLLCISVVTEAAEKIKLTGSELAERISGYEVLAGESNEDSFHFMVVAYSNGTRDLYWNDGLKSGIDKGNHQIVGDQMCVSWKNSFEGEQLCYDVFKTGDNRYESYRNGLLAFSYYKIR